VTEIVQNDISYYEVEKETGGVGGEVGFVPLSSNPTLFLLCP